MNGLNNLARWFSSPGVDTSGFGGQVPDRGKPVPRWETSDAAAVARRVLELLGFPQFEETWSDTASPRGIGGPGSREWPGVYKDLLYRRGLRYMPPRFWRGQWEGYRPEVSEDEAQLLRRWKGALGERF